MRFVDRGKRMLWVGVVLAGALIYGGFQALPLYRKVKRERALKHVEEARSAFEKGEFQAAQTPLQLAHGLAPNEPAVLRLAARMASAVDAPIAVDYWQALLTKDGVTRQDKLDYASLLLRLKRWDLLDPLMLHLAGEKVDEFEFQDIAIRSFKARGRMGRAKKAALIMLRRFPNDDRAMIHFGELALMDQDPAKQEEAVRLLWSVAVRDGPLRDEALLLLASAPGRTPAEVRNLLTLLEEQSNPTTRIKLATLDLQREGDPELALEDQVRSVLEWGRQPKLAPADRLVIADWLLTRRQPSAVLELLPEQVAREDFGYLQRHLQALAMQNRWEEIRQWIEDDTTAMHPVVRDVFHAVAAWRDGDVERVVGYLNSASSNAVHDPELMKFVARYAEFLRQPRIAAHTLLPLLALPSHVNDVSKDILRLMERLEDPIPIMTTIDRLAEFHPEDVYVQNEKTWWHLTQEGGAPIYLQRAREYHAKNPENPLLIATLALARLIEKNPDGAIELLEPLMDGADANALRVRLIYAAALGVTGQAKAARDAAQPLQGQLLRGGEKELVAAWLTSPQGQQPRGTR